MRAQLSNVTTSDDYTTGNTLRLPRARRITLQVANAAVVYQLDESEEGKGQWTDEAFLGPSIGSLARFCSGIRFRSALAGAPAQVTCELLDEDGADSLGAFTATVSVAGGVELPGGGAVTGIVSGAGAIISGSGFSVLRTGTGRYLITFGAAFVQVPIFLATVNSAGGFMVSAVSVSTTQVDLSIVRDDGVLADQTFSFLAQLAA